MEGHPAPTVDRDAALFPFHGYGAHIGDVAEVSGSAVLIRFIFSNVPMTITGGTDPVVGELMRFKVGKKAN